MKHKDPDYSAVYAVIKTSQSDGLEGHGLTFTLGRGNELGKSWMIATPKMQMEVLHKATRQVKFTLPIFV